MTSTDETRQDVRDSEKGAVTPREVWQARIDADFPDGAVVWTGPPDDQVAVPTACLTVVDVQSGYPTLVWYALDQSQGYEGIVTSYRVVRDSPFLVAIRTVDSGLWEARGGIKGRLAETMRAQRVQDRQAALMMASVLDSERRAQVSEGGDRG